MLEHKRECTGRWELTGVVGAGQLRCSRCGAAFAASAVNTAAAFEDNYLGARMRELSAEGQLLLAGEGPTGPELS